MITNIFFKKVLRHFPRSSMLKVFATNDYSTQHLEKYEAEDDTHARFLQTLSPWVIYPYEEQLQRKKAFCLRVSNKLKNLMTECLGQNNQSPLFLQHIEKHRGLAFSAPDVIPSPITEGYRNKNYASTGFNNEGKPQIGFFVQAPQLKKSEVLLFPSPSLQQEQYELMKAFTEVVRDSGIPPCFVHNIPSKAHWKKFCIRSNEQGHMMVSVVMSPDSERPSICAKGKDLALDFFENGAGKLFDVKSLFFQECPLVVCTDGRYPFTLLRGENHLEETLCGSKFKISPETFFQINTQAAQVMYEEIKDMCSLKKDTVLLDICCGTGTIGIVLGKHVKKVIGIEKVPQAVCNAITNAEANGLNNTGYICGSAEKYLSRFIEGLYSHTREFGDIVAVVNPARNGLGKNLLRALRNCEAINKVVYISCKPAGNALHNFFWLCQPAHKPDPKTYGRAFLPTDVRALDMFPHTKHFELILLFER